MTTRLVIYMPRSLFARPKCSLTSPCILVMPTEFEIRQRNAKFAKDARLGKKPTNPSRQELLAKKSPLNSYALGLVLFVVLGGVVFELIRIVFL